eukprot:scaffold34103_cov253-Isochrysis_galbana.AAC.3
MSRVRACSCGARRFWAPCSHLVFGRRQKLGERRLSVGGEGGGELDVQHKEEVAVLEGRLQPWHAFALHRLHHALEGVLGRVRDHVELGALGRLHRTRRLGEGALLEDGAAALLDEGTDALAFELAALDRLLAHRQVLRLGHGRVLDGRAVLVVVQRPCRRRLLGEGVIRHWPEHVAWGRLDDERAAVQVLEFHLEATQRLAQRDCALDVEIVAPPLEVGMRLRGARGGGGEG